MLCSIYCEHTCTTIQQPGSRLREIELDELTGEVPLIYSACQPAQGAQSGARNVIIQTMFRLNKFIVTISSYIQIDLLCAAMRYRATFADAYPKRGCRAAVSIANRNLTL